MIAHRKVWEVRDGHIARGSGRVVTAVMDLATKPLKVSTPAQVHAAHHRIRSLAAQIVGPVAGYDVALMACEAMTNAVLHGHGTVTVTVSCGDDSLRVEVRDDGPALRVAGRVDHGRGLTLIGELAARWDLTVTDSGTVLWFEVNRGAE
jgi:anti-sigma regulatory factor (Ser/Thr protein kinase)